MSKLDKREKLFKQFQKFKNSCFEHFNKLDQRKKGELIGGSIGIHGYYCQYVFTVFYWLKLSLKPSKNFFLLPEFLSDIAILSACENDDKFNLNALFQIKTTINSFSETKINDFLNKLLNCTKDVDFTNNKNTHYLLISNIPIPETINQDKQDNIKLVYSKFLKYSYENNNIHSKLRSLIKNKSGLTNDSDNIALIYYVLIETTIQSAMELQKIKENVISEDYCLTNKKLKDIVENVTKKKRKKVSIVVSQMGLLYNISSDELDEIVDEITHFISDKKNSIYCDNISNELSKECNCEIAKIFDKNVDYINKNEIREILFNESERECFNLIKRRFNNQNTLPLLISYLIYLKI